MSAPGTPSSEELAAIAAAYALLARAEAPAAAPHAAWRIAARLEAVEAGDAERRPLAGSLWRAEGRGA